MSSDAEFMLQQCRAIQQWCIEVRERARQRNRAAQQLRVKFEQIQVQFSRWRAYRRSWPGS